MPDRVSRVTARCPLNLRVRPAAGHDAKIALVER